MNYKKLEEEPLKSAIQQDFFKNYRYTQLGNIDFVIAKHNIRNNAVDLLEDFDKDLKSILWAEAKKGTKQDIYESFVQLLLTIGKERTFETNLPPKYVGAFDAEKFAFIEYSDVQDVFVQNDFNWNVTPSKHDTKEFRQLYNLCKNKLEENAIIFYYNKDLNEFKKFISANFKVLKDVSEKISVTKNNFAFVYQKWTQEVQPTINIPDWSAVNRAGIMSADFFLADLLSDESTSLIDNLFVVLRKDKYEFAKKIDDLGLFSFSTTGFTDKQKAYNNFWKKYARPPKEEYWDYIINRRDLLVPQDIRERKGSYFTPQIWVEKSQEYLAKVLGENWQDEYFIWDCCAGTGNMENGLTNYDNVWASTIDQPDIDVMKERIDNGWNMPENHIFQFDFLNDDFSKCPEELQEILKDDEKRKKLVVYINPPYAEGDSRKGKGRKGVAISQIQKKFGEEIGYAKRELFIQFMARIYREIPNCILGQFSTLKVLQAPKFFKFREMYLAKLEKSFLMPADTFDNVDGQFPIAFNIWNTEIRETFNGINADVFDSDGNPLPQKWLTNVDGSKFINDWAETFIESDKETEKKNSIANIIGVANDFQHQNTVVIENPNKKWNHQFQWQITKNNLIQSSIYLTVRWNESATWINDRDQIFFPNDRWENDKEFQGDCLVNALFHTQNRLTSSGIVNHWIPFTREQVGCKKTFKSNFMSDFINGKIKFDNREELFESDFRYPGKMTFSLEAQAVYDAALEIWKYYHSQINANPNASFYDIKKHFQGEENGRMKSKSEDKTYSELLHKLRSAQRKLNLKIRPKIYEYGFLK